MVSLDSQSQCDYLDPRRAFMPGWRVGCTCAVHTSMLLPCYGRERDGCSVPAIRRRTRPITGTSRAYRSPPELPKLDIAPVTARQSAPFERRRGLENTTFLSHRHSMYSRAANIALSLLSLVQLCYDEPSCGLIHAPSNHGRTKRGEIRGLWSPPPG